MKKLHFSLFLIFVLLMTLSGVAQQQQQRVVESIGLSAQRLEHLTRTFNQYVEEEKLAGAVILVTRRGQITYFESFGQSDREKKVSMTDNTIFRIASQTKAIASVGIMMLQEEGKLLIGDPVGKYIPEFMETTVAVASGDDGEYDVIKANRPITIRDLLTHTAGIGYGNGPAADQWKQAGIQGWYFADREEPILETVRRMAALPFDAQPGEKYVYGYNTDILGAIIEVVSGESLDSFLTSRILRPLGMTDTHFYLPENKKDRLAVVYSATEQGLERAPEPGGMVGQGMYAEGPRTSFSAGAGLLSTAMDYSRFLRMLLNEGSLEGVRILSPKSVQLMTVDHLGEIDFPWSEGTGFGLGFEIVTDLGARGVPGSVGEYGWGGAYHSDYWVDPQEEMVVVYFTQLIPAGGLDDHQKLRALIYQAIIE